MSPQENDVFRLLLRNNVENHFPVGIYSRYPGSFRDSYRKCGDDEKKYDIKLNLIRMFYKKGYNKQQVAELFQFIDWVISLPKYLEDKITDEIRKIEEEIKVTYVTNIERQGIKRGEKLAEIRIAEKMLNMEFSADDVVKATGLTKKEVKALKKKLGLS